MRLSSGSTPNARIHMYRHLFTCAHTHICICEHQLVLEGPKVVRETPGISSHLSCRYGDLQGLGHITAM